MPYSTSQVSRIVGISVQSVRDWTRTYAPLLSPEARGESGTRQFGDDDLNTMRTIAALRATGYPPDEIMRRMQDGSTPPVVDATPQPAPQEAPEATLSPTTILSSIVGRLDASDARFLALERRVEQQRAEQQTLLRDRQQYGITMLMIGVGIGIVVMAAIFYAVYMVWFQVT